MIKEKKPGQDVTYNKQIKKKMDKIVSNTGYAEMKKKVM